jgi:hypothetical protein
LNIERYREGTILADNVSRHLDEAVVAELEEAMLKVYHEGLIPTPDMVSSMNLIETNSSSTIFAFAECKLTYFRRPESYERIVRSQMRALREDFVK